MNSVMKSEFWAIIRLLNPKSLIVKYNQSLKAPMCSPTSTPRPQCLFLCVIFFSHRSYCWPWQLTFANICTCSRPLPEQQLKVNFIVYLFLLDPHELLHCSSYSSWTLYQVRFCVKITTTTERNRLNILWVFWVTQVDLWKPILHASCEVLTS